MAAVIIPYAIERELVGICKQSMVQMRITLRQYIDELHADLKLADIDPIIQAASNELCGRYSFDQGFHTNKSALSKRATAHAQSFREEQLIIEDVVGLVQSSVDPIPPAMLTGTQQTSTELGITAVKQEPSASTSFDANTSSRLDGTNQSQPVIDIDMPNTSGVPINTDLHAMFSSPSTSAQQQVIRVHHTDPGSSWNRANEQFGVTVPQPLMQRAKAPPRKFCIYCSRHLPTGTSQLAPHIQEKHPEYVTKEICPKSKELERFYHCLMCAYKTPALQSVIIHFHRNHGPNPKTHKCPVCFKSFKMHANLMLHREGAGH